MLLIIDNYDSFVFNVARYCEELGRKTLTVRNDRLSLADIGDIKPDAILISPGPCTPREAGISLAAVEHFSGRVPILGICLGHQCIGSAFGGAIVRARKPMHGRSSLIEHNGGGLFASLPNPLQVGLYHSLAVETRPGMERDLSIDAVSPDGEIMALSHRTYPTFGVQFHPESVLTWGGHTLLSNFFELERRWWATRPARSPDYSFSAASTISCSEICPENAI